MKEIWKEIPGYEGVYWASTLGHVRSTNGVLKPSKHRDGYLKVVFCVKGVRKTYQVHRLIALTFIPNPDNLPQINHKDENKTNNHIDNLEWCTMDYNIHYGTGQIRCRNRGLPSNARPVSQYSLNGEFIARYPSTMEAERQTGVAQANINACARHVHHQMCGYVWRFDGEPFTPVPEPKRGKEIVQLDKDGNIIKIWPTILSASKGLGMKYPSYLQDCVKGRKPTCRGYIWKYKHELNKDVI